NYRHEKHEFLVMDASKGVSFTTSFYDETQIKQMVTGLRDLLIHLYTLVGLTPSFFVKPKGQGDLIPDYGYNIMMIFRSILPRDNS
ncbi:hypothetical protein EOX18_22165, partial [Salmonella enterica]|nr:hypothetical protein [Salmonella enterica]EAR1371868.1 hypothetical protein [Salmonella enterica]EAR5031990.1 hypothetical protein [Salmonella enterica]EBK7683449.1 hypothetical protein [Salmonella enterica]